VICNHGVAGSIPAAGTISWPLFARDRYERDRDCNGTQRIRRFLERNPGAEIRPLQTYPGWRKQQHEQIIAAMKTALTPYVTPEGIVLDSSSWKITARNPD
jgi:hypothetical protein